MPAAALRKNALALGGPPGSEPRPSPRSGGRKAAAHLADLHGRVGPRVCARVDIHLSAAWHQDATGRYSALPVYARARVSRMRFGFPTGLSWRAVGRLRSSHVIIAR